MFIIKAKKKEKSLFKKIKLLSKLRTELMNDKIAIDICEENNVDKEFLAGVPIDFDELDVAAKTVNAKIILNESLMEKSFKIMMRYLIHELVHAIQHCEKKGKETKEDKVDEYLDKPSEIEAFQQQVRYEAKENGVGAAEEYLDGLFDHHDLSEKERKEKKEELMEEVD